MKTESVIVREVCSVEVGFGVESACLEICVGVTTKSGGVHDWKIMNLIIKKTHFQI